MPRYLAIDHGRRRIGLAVGDSETRVASPVAGVAACESQARTIESIARVSEQFGADEIVVGLPLNMDGTEGPQASLVRKFAAELERALRKPVRFWDERLSSFTADEKLEPAGLTRKKRKTRIDGVAAQSILQEFLDSLPPVEPRVNRPDAPDPGEPH